MKRTRKPKAQRDSLDKRIARAKTAKEKLWLAALGRPGPLEGVAMFVKGWKFLRQFHAANNDIGPTETMCVETMKYFVRAMFHNKPEMLEAVAKEMRRQNKEKEWTPDKVALELVTAHEFGKANYGDIGKMMSRDPSAIARKARSMGFKSRKGRPKKSDS